MKLVVDQRIFEKFQRVVIGVVVAKGMNNRADVGEVHRMIREEEARIRAQYVKDKLSQEPRIAAWRKAYAAFGVKSHDAKCSVENLYRMVLSGKEVRAINPLVDIYNYISLKYMVPVGGEDLDKVVGGIQLTFAGAHESLVKLLGDHTEEAPPEGEVLYKDDVSALCRRWNWREAERTMLTEDTRNAILVLEGLPPVTRDEVEAAVKELQEFVQKYCGGTARLVILTPANTEIILD